MIDRHEFIKEIVCTDVEFGVTGGMYITDWDEGWTRPRKGRIYRVFNEAAAAAPIVSQTKTLLADGMEQRTPDELAKLLAHPDQRMRQEAQFELADRGDPSISTLAAVARKKRVPTPPHPRHLGPRANWPQKPRRPRLPPHPPIRPR